MTNGEPFKICPACHAHRPVAELSCENPVNGVPCGWDIVLEAIHEPQAGETGAGVEQPAPETRGVLLCRNGHPYSEGDLVCLICDDDLSSTESTSDSRPGDDQPDTNPSPGTGTRQIAGWEVVEERPTTFRNQQHFVVCHSNEAARFLLTLYRAGSEPDPAIYDLLRKFSLEHVPRLHETGHWEGQAYEVGELLSGGSVRELPVDGSDISAIERFLAELGQVLSGFSEAGLRHRDIRPETILIRTRQPLDLVVSGFGSARLSDLDLEIAAPIETGRYTAPETVMGGISAASDWWGLGMVLLDKVTNGRCFAGADDQLFMIHVIAHGVTVPEGLHPRLTTLLRGLLTVDRTERWHWKQVQLWLKGEDVPVSQPEAVGTSSSSGPSIRLGGRDYFSVLQFSLAAARASAWEEACGLLERGAIAGWVRELDLESRVLSALEQLTSRTDISSDFRLAVGLQLLNPTLPIICKEAIVSPAWLLANPESGFALLSGPVPELLLRFGLQSQAWLLQLAKRLESARKRADSLSIQLEENQFRFCSVVSSRVQLSAIWDERRQLFPEANLPALSSIIDRRNYSEEDLILLSSAAVGQFRSVDEVITATLHLAGERSLAAPESELLHSLLQQPRFQLYQTLERRTEGFARCEIVLIDEWVDNFRIRRRLDVEQLLIVLAIPEDLWIKPPHQGYLTSLLKHFEKKVSGSVLRGPLVKMTIGKTTPRIDITELGLELKDASSILERILAKSERQSVVLPQIFENEPNPEHRLRRLENHSAAYQRDTGVNGLCLGFPFVVLNDQPTKRQPRLAPVLLWPVTLKSSVGQRDQFSVAFDSVRDEVRLNPAFDGMLGNERAKDWREAANSLMTQASIGISAALDAFGLLATVAGRELVPVPDKQAAERIRHNTLVPAAVLFHVEFIGQSLVEDLRLLPQQKIEGTALETMLRIGAAPNERAQARTNDLRFMVAASDPSQENAIAEAFGEKGVVIQGPPGTGKSQTIVNLVADAIGQHKSVLVVCQKLPALDVVRKRLEAHGLQDRICMVTNVNGDRETIVREIRDQIAQLSNGQVSIDFGIPQRRGDLQTKILAIEEEVNDIFRAGQRQDSACGRSYVSIVDELLSIELEHGTDIPDVTGLRRLLTHVSAVSLERLEESCADVGPLWLNSNFENSPYSQVQDVPHDDASISEFRTSLESLHSAVEARRQILKETPNAITVDNPDDAENWIHDNEAFFRSFAADDFNNLQAKVECFGDDSGGSQLIQSLRDLKELYRSSSQACEEVATLRSVLSRCPEDRIRRCADSSGQLSTLWMASRFTDNPLQQMKNDPFDAASVAAFRESLENLENTERERNAVVKQPFKGNDVSNTAELSKWLGQYGSTLQNIDSPTARRIKELYGLFDTSSTRKSKGATLLALTRDFSDRLTKLDLSAYIDSIGRIVASISPSEVMSWINAAPHFVNKPSLVGKLNPVRVLALRRVKQLLTQSSVVADAASIQAVGIALLLEAQVLEVRRNWEPNSAFAAGVTDRSHVPSLIELKDEIEAAARDLDITSRVYNGLANCPLRIRIDVSKLDNPASFRSLVKMADLLVRRSSARAKSLAAIETLREWMSDEWCHQAVEAVSRMAADEADNGCPVKAVLAALPKLESFATFRDELRKAGPVVLKTFEALSPLRQRIEDLSQISPLHQVVRAIVLFNGLAYQIERSKRRMPAIAGFTVSTEEELTLSLRSLERLEEITKRLTSCPCIDAERTNLVIDASVTTNFFARMKEGIRRGKAVRQCKAVLEDFSSWVSDTWKVKFLKHVESNSPSTKVTQELKDALPSLKDFLVFRRRASGFSREQQQCFTELAKARDFLHEGGAELAGCRIKTVIRREGLLAWKALLESQLPQLLTKRSEFDRRINSLRTSLEGLKEADKKLLTNNFAANAIGPTVRWDDITRLRGPRRVSLRTFFQNGESLGLRSLRPVWLMIPDVVSQVLPRVAGLFDIVVFDEASQMPVEHSLPSLFRARTVVVSGDEKQMPPSSFFSSRMESDETDDENDNLSEDELTEQERDAQEEAWNRREIKDCPDLLHLAESILPRTMLQIHYRSRYRELISFSNAAYYRNELSVPVIHPDKTILADKPLEYIPVKGIYEKQTNEIEAKKVIAYLESIWNQPVQGRPSIGVVTFNRKQADLIDDLLEARAEKSAKFRDALIAERSRRDNGEDMSFFVKNVENVQGDERDLIVFSTTFGRNRQGTFRRNFGVLGQSGGERRLNVAITRARTRVALVTSMPVQDVSDMLNVQRAPVSPRDYLQGYLEYARLMSSGNFEEGRRLASRMNAGRRSESDALRPLNGFQNSVFAYLSSLGYQICRPEPDPVLGIDFAIIDPHTGLFGVGVECDLPTHKLLSTARAREIWRPSVIGATYRAFVRVSASDWLQDRTSEQQRILREIRSVIGEKT
jgi:serine/threonine protein kinase